MKVATYLNLLTTNVPYILKQVNWFVLQINWLVSIWWATLVVNGLLSSEQLGVSSRNSDTLKSEHLHMRKLPFILSRLHFTNQVLIRQNTISLFFNFMRWHDIETYTVDNHQQLKITDVAANLLTLFSRNWFLVCKLHTNDMND